MNRLHPHFAKQAAQKPKKRLQREIAADYRDDIIGLIAEDGANLTEVTAAVRAEGEPVLEHGFKAAIFKHIGTVKNIRAGLVKPGSSQIGDRASLDNAAPTHPPINPNQNATLLDDNDDDFVARRPRS